MLNSKALLNDNSSKFISFDTIKRFSSVSAIWLEIIVLEIHTYTFLNFIKFARSVYDTFCTL